MTAALHALPVRVERAPLPVVYEQARTALARCYEIDECKQWADKASAIASYARQVNDDSLLDLSKRIKGRAVRQMGLLLRAIEPAANQHDANARAGSGLSTRTKAADDAGLSERQRKNALRVASIPEDEFERQIDGDSPPTIEQLAKIGTQKQILEGVDPSDHAVGSKLIGLIRHVTRESGLFDIEQGVRGVKPSELRVLHDQVQAAIDVLVRVMVLVEQRRQIEKEGGVCIQASN
jgi:hypothetical protein